MASQNRSSSPQRVSTSHLAGVQTSAPGASQKPSGKVVAPGPSHRTAREASGKVITAPDDWVLLEPGDAALTRRVKAAGDHRRRSKAAAVKGAAARTAPAGEAEV